MAGVDRQMLDHCGVSLSEVFHSLCTLRHSLPEVYAHNHTSDIIHPNQPQSFSTVSDGLLVSLLLTARQAFVCVPKTQQM